MFRIYQTTSRSALLRSPTSEHCIRSFYPTPTPYASHVQRVKKQPQDSKDEELTAYIYEGYGGTRKRRPQGDNKRINIISKKLCDDILERMKPSLLKHTGCDIIEVNPGAALWSSAIHDLLKPRNHILLEPDHELYKPLIKPLLEAKDSTYKFVPKSGAVWSNLQKVLTPEMLPQQEEFKAGDPRQDEPNDTLLFIANLGWHPRKQYRAFPSITTLVIHQLLTAVRAHSLFQRYGLVRMLIWVADEEKKIILPRTIGERKKMTIEAEATCQDIIEVASSATEGGQYKRDHYLNLQSSLSVLKRMEEGGITTPTGRQGPLQIDASKELADHESEDRAYVKRDFYEELEELERRYAAGEFKKLVEDSGMEQRPSITSLRSTEWKRMRQLELNLAKAQKKGKGLSAKLAPELEQLQSKFRAGEFTQYVIPESELLNQTPKRGTADTVTPEYKRMYILQRRVSAEEKKAGTYGHLFEEFEHITAMQKRVSTLESSDAIALQQQIDARSTAFKEAVERQATLDKDTFNHLLDNRRTFHNNPSILYWDRRRAEPLKVIPSEFYPNHEMCLLDFHPKPIWPVLRENYPANYDVFEYIVSSLLILPTQSVRQGFTALAPGAFEWLVSECPSVTDPNKGGSPDLDFLTVRCLSLEMYKEIIEAWMEWPFRPSRYELLKRMGSAAYDPDEETGDGKVGE